VRGLRLGRYRAQSSTDLARSDRLVSMRDSHYTVTTTIKMNPFPKPVGEITDRAKRYRAQSNVTGPKKCVLCGAGPKGGRPLDVMHLSGDESDGDGKNLAYGCRTCNSTLAAAFKRIGSKVRTRQYNPASKTVPTFQQYAWAVSNHSRGAHDEGGAIIHATPKSKRIEYARRIASTRAERYDAVPF
jgi:hypothetical protein